MIKCLVTNLICIYIGQDNVPEADDAKRVDNMDSGKVEDFLRDRHKSSAAMRRTE